MWVIILLLDSVDSWLKGELSNDDRTTDSKTNVNTATTILDDRPTGVKEGSPPKKSLTFGHCPKVPFMPFVLCSVKNLNMQKKSIIIKKNKNSKGTLCCPTFKNMKDKLSNN